ncbi:actinodin2 [Stigmatopora nigra]
MSAALIEAIALRADVAEFFSPITSNTWMLIITSNTWMLIIPSKKMLTVTPQVLSLRHPEFDIKDIKAHQTHLAVNEIFNDLGGPLKTDVLVCLAYTGREERCWGPQNSGPTLAKNRDRLRTTEGRRWIENMATHSLIWAGFLLVFVFLPDFLGAAPLEPQKQEDVVVGAVTGDVKAEVVANLKELVRRRRNAPVVPVPQFQRLPDFWGWYKYFMESHNQEGVEDLDRLYLAYLQNKHRSEEGPTFNHYLNHLSGVYKACADSDDPECISESTSKPKATSAMPAPIKSAPVRMCNPYLDPYCLFPMTPKVAAPESAPAKAPAPVLTPILPIPQKSPTGYYYYAPVLEPFLSHEQKSELLRICNHEDVECLQYHLRAAYGYRPASGPAPSYAALKCNPKDPYCKPILAQKAPSGYYHLLSPSCDPALDPLCAPPAGPAADSAPQHCNPLFDAGCNPLTATKLSGLTKPVVEYAPKGQPAHMAAPLTCDPREDPFCILTVAAALRKPQLPEHQVRHKLGIRGKTKEGHDCYVHYDKECTPTEPQPKTKTAPEPRCHPFDPTCGKFTAPPAVRARGTGEGDIIFPDPDCDPELDYNCRLRRGDATDAAAAMAAQLAKEAKKPVKSSYGYFDFLRGVVSKPK